MTGMPASGPMSPSPSTRVPSLTTATRFARFVYSYERETSSLMALHGAATPGVYHTAKSPRSRMQHFGAVCIFPL